MSLEKTAVVVSTYHKTMEGGGLDLIFTYRDQNFPNFYLLFDNKSNQTQEKLNDVYKDINLCTYNEEDFKTHKFDRPISRFHRWGSHQNPNYFYAHFRMLLFWLKNPNFEYYWFFDDDVIFEGDLKGLLSNYDSHSFDFVAIQAFKKEDYGNELPYVPKINQKMGSNGHWLSFAPGPGDEYQTCERHLGSFFPIVRFSNKAMKYLYDLNQQDFFGYSEGFVPTTLASVENFSVASMLDEEDRYYIPNNVECDLKHKGSNFTWTWI
jgi:hypothetical protein